MWDTSPSPDDIRRPRVFWFASLCVVPVVLDSSSPIPPSVLLYRKRQPTMGTPPSHHQVAQQMSGRAGRRGLDTQGNLLYMNMSWPKIQALMLGDIPAIVGRDPLYPTIALHHALSGACLTPCRGGGIFLEAFSVLQ